MQRSRPPNDNLHKLPGVRRITERSVIYRNISSNKKRYDGIDTFPLRSGEILVLDCIWSFILSSNDVEVDYSSTVHLSASVSGF